MSDALSRSLGVVAPPVKQRPLPIGVGLGIGAVVSLLLWGGIIWSVAQVL